MRIEKIREISACVRAFSSVDGDLPLKTKEKLNPNDEYVMIHDKMSHKTKDGFFWSVWPRLF